MPLLGLYLTLSISIISIRVTATTPCLIEPLLRECEQAQTRHQGAQMPIYEYRCHACGRSQSIFFRNMTATPQPVCPNCGTSEMERLISRVAILKPEAERISEFDGNRA